MVKRNPWKNKNYKPNKKEGKHKSSKILNRFKSWLLILNQKEKKIRLPIVAFDWPFFGSQSQSQPMGSCVIWSHKIIAHNYVIE